MNVVIYIVFGICVLLCGGIVGWFAGIAYEGRRVRKDQNALRDAFGALAAEELEKSRARLAAQAAADAQTQTAQLTQHKDAIKEIVTPLAQRLDAFNKERQEAYGNITAVLENVTRTQGELHKETRNLVNALRRPEVRGRWGEVTLRRVVELAGMTAHVDFTEQTVSGDARLRPDMIIALPNGHSVVVDAKVALDAYLTACETTDEEAREKAYENHARQMKDHMMKLSQKSYWDSVPDTASFVIMFVPGDVFLSTALAVAPQLVDEALQRKVIIATPSTLMAVLRTIEMGWRQITLQKNAQQISEEGREMYTRLRIFIGHLATLQKKIADSVAAFNKVVGSYESRVLPGVRRMRELGADDGNACDELTSIDEPVRDVMEENNAEK